MRHRPDFQTEAGAQPRRTPRYGRECLFQSALHHGEDALTGRVVEAEEVHPSRKTV